MLTSQPHARFVGGTLVLEGVDQTVSPPACFEWVNGKWRCPAVHYRTVWPWLGPHSVQNHVPRWHDLALTLHDGREPHDYQQDSLAAWHQADR